MFAENRRDGRWAPFESPLADLIAPLQVSTARERIAGYVRCSVGQPGYDCRYGSIRLERIGSIILTEKCRSQTLCYALRAHSALTPRVQYDRTALRCTIIERFKARPPWGSSTPSPSRCLLVKEMFFLCDFVVSSRVWNVLGRNRLLKELCKCDRICVPGVGTVKFCYESIFYHCYRDMEMMA